jgi:hypothetical protein
MGLLGFLAQGWAWAYMRNNLSRFSSDLSVPRFNPFLIDYQRVRNIRLSNIISWNFENPVRLIHELPINIHIQRFLYRNFWPITFILNGSGAVITFFFG